MIPRSENPRSSARITMMLGRGLLVAAHVGRTFRHQMTATIASTVFRKSPFSFGTRLIDMNDLR